jgi:hypothetical protein
MPEKKASKAASPPADAPMPTIGNMSSGCLLSTAAGAESAIIAGSSFSGDAVCGLVAVFFFFIKADLPVDDFLNT